MQYRKVGDGVGAKVVVPSRSRNSLETFDPGEDDVDLEDIVFGVQARRGATVCWA
jgi:hypothetical protein